MKMNDETTQGRKMNIRPETLKVLEELKSIYGRFLTMEEEQNLPPEERNRYFDVLFKIQETE